jgi:Toluene-4-monooxygenase system protein B (TmoB)
MALFPIYGVFQGDFVPHLVAVDTDDTMAQVAEKIAVHSVGRRLPARSGTKGYSVRIDGAEVPGAAPLSQVMVQTGLKPLQWVCVDWAR